MYKGNELAITAMENGLSLKSIQHIYVMVMGMICNSDICVRFE